LKVFICSVILLFITVFLAVLLGLASIQNFLWEIISLSTGKSGW